MTVESKNADSKQLAALAANAAKLAASKSAPTKSK
jgi:hypothetical protein